MVAGLFRSFALTGAQATPFVVYAMLGLYSPVMASTESMISDSAFPDFPAENPSKHELKEWLDVFKDALITAGFGLTLRGEPPRECANKVDRILLPVPGEDGVAKISALSENSKIAAYNAGNKIERDTIMREYKAR